MINRLNIKYLELDDDLYIENGIIKNRLKRENGNQEYCTWDEMWNRVHHVLLKIKNYEENDSSFEF